MVAPNQPPAPDPHPLADVAIPARSVLYSIKPLGLGTGMVESLRSLLHRLATAHCVKIVDLWGFVANRFQLQGSAESPSISLKGDRAEQIADALSTLTTVPGLKRTTLNPVQSNARICIRVRDQRAWCPLCLAADQEPYDRLLWEISSVRHCPIHSIPLQTKCPTCRRPQSLSSARRSPIKCASCGADMTAGASHVPYPQADPFEAWVADQTSNVIQHFDFRTGSNSTFIENQTKLITSLGGMKPAARTLGIGLSSLRSWKAAEFPPSLEGVLRLSWAAQVSLVELLSVAIDAVTPRAQFPVWRPRTYRKSEVSAKDYLYALRTFLLRHPFEVPSNTTLQQLVGGSHRHPELQKATVQTALELARRRRLLTRHRHQVWTVICRIHRAYRACRQDHRPLTIRNLCSYGANTRTELARRYVLLLRQQSKTGHQVPNPHDRLPQDIVGYWTSLGLM